MRIVWLFLISNFLFCVICCVADAGITIQDLKGNWVPVKYLDALHNTMSPYAGPITVVAIGRSHDCKAIGGTGYSVVLSGADSQVYDVMALKCEKETNICSLRVTIDLRRLSDSQTELAEESKYNYTSTINIKIKTNYAGNIESVSFLDKNWVHPDYFEKEFIRIDTPLYRYINRVLFSGTWTDKSGKVFVFCECGRGYTGDGKSFKYEVPLGLPSISKFPPFWIKRYTTEEYNPFQPDEVGHGYYRFDRRHNRLHIFKDKIGRSDKYDIVLYKKK